MNKETKITYVNNISVKDYNALRKSVNWINVTEKRAAIALKNSFYLCVAVCDLSLIHILCFFKAVRFLIVHQIICL